MKSVWKCLVQCTAVVGVSVSLSAIVAAQDANPEGIVRIASKPGTRDVQTGSSAGGLRPVSAMMMQNCAPSAGAGGAGSSDPSGAGQGSAGAIQPGGSGFQAADGLGAGGYPYNCPPGIGGYGGHRCCCLNGAALEYLKCKFGYFIPTGGGGRGIPWVGCYSRVYPVNPYYRDGRDGQMWAAQGYGLPMAVPLAPVVGHTYDLSWGIPSSRLTPVSNPAY